MFYTIRQISELTNSQFIGNQNAIIEHIAYDSRTIYSNENTAFIALETPRNSGKKYISDAIEKGIKTIIATERTTDQENINWILVENPLKFLQLLAKKHLENQTNLKTIGITGSNGKTIVKEWLFQCLNSDFQVVKSPKSYNSQLGLPLSVLQANENHQIGLFEVGISQSGEMGKLAEILHPKIGIFTYLGTAHLANYKDSEELIDEKLKLFENSETIIFNGDNDLVVRKINQIYSNKTLISFGLNADNDFTIEDRNSSNQNLIFKFNGEAVEIPVKQRDEATLSNALCVCAVLKYLGFPNEKIVQKINALKSVEMRLESITGKNNNLIINDSYNLDLDSLKIAFQFISEYKKPAKVLVLTDFVDAPESLYPQIVKLCNDQKFSKIFLIGKEICKYAEDFHTETFTFNDTDELIKNQEFNSLSNSLILIKGARKFQTEKLKNHLELQKHDTVLEVNLNALLHNINIHKSYLKPETKMMAMVKAFAYGTGGYEIAEFLQHHHIDYLGVAYADEGADLRKNGITVPIMVMNPEQHSYDAIIDYQLEPEIYSFRVLDLFCEKLQEKGIQEKYPIHIKLETGMHRLGFKENELDDLIHHLKSKNVVVKTTFSHLSTADMPDEAAYAKQQLKTYDRMSSKLIQGLGYQPIRHILNSPGITTYPEYQYDMVRIGIGMYGISYDEKIKSQLRSVVTFKTVISQISEVHSGESVGYSRRFKPEKNTRIATVPVGYADGIPRLIGNGIGKIGIKNQLVPIVGNICMDMMMVNIGDLEAQEGDEVIIFNSKPDLETFSGYCQTIPYEVLTSISRRVKRIYIKD